MFFADDDAHVAHCVQDLQSLLIPFSSTCAELGLSISFKKTKVLSQRTDIPNKTRIKDKYIKNVKIFYTLTLVLCRTLQRTPK